MGRFAIRALLSAIAAGVVTAAAIFLVPTAIREAGRVAPTVGFTYLLLVLVIATAWGFVEASITSVAATLSLNYYFLPPVGRFTIADPQNWVALFSFLATSLIASRLSTLAKRRALDAVARQQDLERLYSFSRAILLIDQKASFAKELVRILADVFQFTAVVFYDRLNAQFHRAGPSDFEGLDDQLRDAALQGTFYADPTASRSITAVRLGSNPIAGLGLQSARMPDAVVQGIANLVAIGLERARAQDLAAQVEAARQSEKLRTSLLDAMAHEFKTPLTSVIAATTALQADPAQPLETRTELLKIADEEARHLQQLIDDAVDMGRLDTADIRVDAEVANAGDVVCEAIESMRTTIDERPLVVEGDRELPEVVVDRRLLKLAIKQILGNAVKYSPPGTPIRIDLHNSGPRITVTVTDCGAGIPEEEQKRIFDRLYRSPSVLDQIPGSGLGLSIAQNIVRAHRGELTVKSRPGETSFQISLPVEAKGANS
jgi:two-component system sensor histidine kinase KdpD